MGTSSVLRLSGMQKQVFALYRGLLRAARSKPPDERSQIETTTNSCDASIKDDGNSKKVGGGPTQKFSLREKNMEIFNSRFIGMRFILIMISSFSGQDDSSEHDDILEWAKANKHGSLLIICQYYQLQCPKRGLTIKFKPLKHFHHLEYHRPDEAVLHVAGAAIDLRSCSTSLELAEARAALMVEEEASSLSV